MKLVGYCISTCDSRNNIFHPRGDLFEIYDYTKETYGSLLRFRVKNVRTGELFHNSLDIEDIKKHSFEMKPSILLKLII